MTGKRKFVVIDFQDKLVAVRQVENGALLWYVNCKQSLFIGKNSSVLITSNKQGFTVL